jgi:hypothetical protein
MSRAKVEVCVPITTEISRAAMGEAVPNWTPVAPQTAGGLFACDGHSAIHVGCANEHTRHACVTASLSEGQTKTGQETRMSTNTLLIIIVVVLLLGGGGFYFR